MRKKPTYEDLEQRIKALEKSDIKARQAQDALYEIEENFRTIADSTPVAVMLYQDDRWIYVNRAAEIITGYSAKELLCMNFWDIVHPDHKALVQGRGRKRQQGKKTTNRYEFKILTKNGKEKWVDLAGTSISIGGQPAGVITVTDITVRKQHEEKLGQIVFELREALAKVKTLSGFLPICASCKKIRNDKGYWEQLEVYITEHSEALFSHGICPECAKTLYPEHYKNK